MQQKILNAIVDQEDQPKSALIIQKCVVGSKENFEAAKMVVCVCQLLIRKSVDQLDSEGGKFKHFHHPTALFREKVLTINDFWSHLPRTQAKRDLAFNACCINPQRLLTKYERDLFDKLDKFSETKPMISDVNKNEIDLLMSQGGSQVNGANHNSKLLNSIMSDMHIFENNMASFEQKIMENLRHE